MWYSYSLWNEAMRSMVCLSSSFFAYRILSVHRIDAEAKVLKNKLDGSMHSDKPSIEDQEKVSDEKAKATIKVSFSLWLLILSLFYDRNMSVDLMRGDWLRGYLILHWMHSMLMTCSVQINSRFFSEVWNETQNSAIYELYIIMHILCCHGYSGKVCIVQ